MAVATADDSRYKSFFDNAELGDLIEFKRTGYSHWGVLVGMFLFQ